LCALAFVSWLLALAALALLVLAACSGAGRQAAYAAARSIEPEIGGDHNAFMACAREYKLRWSTLLMHLLAWSGCAWAVVVAARRARNEDDDANEDGDANDAEEAPPLPCLWPPPQQQPSSSSPSHPKPSSSSYPLFAARAAALSPLLCACFAFAALCADADLDSGATTAPGVMEWWYALSRGKQPLTAEDEGKYAAVQAMVAGWVLLAACDAAWAVAGVVFASAAVGAGVGAAGRGAGGGGTRWAKPPLLRQHQQPSSSSSGVALARVEIAARSN
jgi:hypothetical protein